MAKSKGVRLKTRAVTVDTGEMKDELRDLAKSTREQVADLARQSLQAQIKAINNAATNRRSALPGNVKISSGTKDKPLENARVVVKSTRSSAGTRGARLVVYVYHNDGSGRNIFNILDAGTRNRTVRSPFTFPMYRGSLIPDRASGSEGLGDPDQVGNIIKPGNVRLLRGPENQAIIIAMQPGMPLKGFGGRKLYDAAASWVEKNLVNKKIVNEQRRSSIRLRRDDVKISVPDRPRFNK